MTQRGWSEEVLELVMHDGLQPVDMLSSVNAARLNVQELGGSDLQSLGFHFKVGLRF